MVRTIFFLAVLAVLFSCKDSSKESQDSSKKDKSANKNVNSVTDDSVNDEYSFLSEYPNKALPFVDSTNFNNINKAKQLTEQQKDLLRLDKILGESYSDIVQSLQINYRVNLSDNFSTIIMSYELGEHELLSKIINYDVHFMPIAWQEIAYDEIAEGLVRKQSKIYKDSIIVSRINYFDEIPDTTFTKFKIEQNGSIVNYE